MGSLQLRDRFLGGEAADVFPAISAAPAAPPLFSRSGTVTGQFSNGNKTKTIQLIVTRGG
jgi:hypothetical protein